jgi:hypothetical protein
MSTKRKNIKKRKKRVDPRRRKLSLREKGIVTSNFDHLAFELPSAKKKFITGYSYIVAVAVGIVTYILALNTLSAKISRPPGARLWAIAEFFCTRKTYRNTFEPLLCDLRIEYHDALIANRKWKARWTRVLYFCAFWKAASLNIVVKLLKQAVQMFRGA